MMINPGISFGLMVPGLKLISIIVIGGLLVWYWKERSMGILLMIMGGVWNLAERLMWGGVRDYWRIPYTSLYNNLADWLIFFGVIIYIWQKIQKKLK